MTGREQYAIVLSRTKLDNEIFNKAVNAYAADEKKNLANLSKYAKEMKLYTRVINVMDDIAASVLAGLKNKAKESERSYQLCLQLLSPRQQAMIL